MGDFRLISFAAIAPTDEVHTYRTPWGIERVVRREGEALHPAREPLEVLEGIKEYMKTNKLENIKDVIGSLR